MKKMILFLACLLAVPSAFAGGTWSAVTVTNIGVYTGATGNGTGSYILVYLSANSTGGPSCSTSQKNVAIVDTSSAAGMYAASLAQAAFLDGKTVSVSGTGTCTISSIEETLAAITELP